MSSIALYSRDGEVRAYTLLDRADFDAVCHLRWYFDGKYAATRIDGRPVRLHRFLFGLQPGDKRTVDHINHDCLDNRRANLRVVSHAENCRNARSQGGASQYRGVIWDKTRKKWRAQARFNYKMRFLGRFDNEREAADAVEAFWREHSELGQAA